jgi:hypothetical protein
VLVEREVIEGDELRRYVDGEIPVPTADELKRESAERLAAAENGTRNGEKEHSGPEIILSAPPTQELPTPQIPSRPD